MRELVWARHGMHNNKDDLTEQAHGSPRKNLKDLNCKGLGDKNLATDFHRLTRMESLLLLICVNPRESVARKLPLS
jgi:hypothetical protein